MEKELIDYKKYDKRVFQYLVQFIMNKLKVDICQSEKRTIALLDSKLLDCDTNNPMVIRKCFNIINTQIN